MSPSDPKLWSLTGMEHYISFSSSRRFLNEEKIDEIRIGDKKDHGIPAPREGQVRRPQFSDCERERNEADLHETQVPDRDLSQPLPHFLKAHKLSF